MRKWILSLGFVLGGVSISSAQETYSLSANATQVTNLTAIVSTSNSQTCLRLTAIESCTQAAACTAAGAVGGASCTAAQARTANARIYPATLAGREEYVTFVWVVPQFLAAVEVPSVFEQERMCLNWQTMTTTQRNTLCTAALRPTGCRLCR